MLSIFRPCVHRLLECIQHSGRSTILVPRGTPTPVIERLAAELAAIVQEPDVKSRLQAMGADVIGSSPAELERFRRAEIEKWTKLAKDNRISLD